MLEPLIMYIVVDYHSYDRREDLYRDTVAATLAVSQDQFTSQYQQQFEQWLSESFRKVSLRAKANQFAKLTSREDCRVVNGVAIFAPIEKTRAGKELNKLQVLHDYLPQIEAPVEEATKDIKQGEAETTETATKDSKQGEAETTETATGIEFILHNMTVGKSVAQISHAAWRARDVLSREESLDFKIAEPSEYQQQAITTVSDAGFTEVEPGTMTVAVIRQN